MSFENNYRLVLSQLGFHPQSPKTVTFFCDDKAAEDFLQKEVHFYITKLGNRKKRVPSSLQARVWKESSFPFPFNIDKGKYIEADCNEVYKGILKLKKSDWGNCWQADFSDFTETGLYQIENEYAFSLPFSIEDDIYVKLERSYLVMLNCQRSGMEIPGVRPMMHADDGRLDSDLSYLPAAGGWYDAGDWRKWLTLTIGNIEALALLIQNSHPAFKKMAADELRWGNYFFQEMISNEGMVYEDLAGGEMRFGFNYEDHWWIENHPGCIAGGGINITDNIPNSGDERLIRVKYNPLAQFQFVRFQAISYAVVDPHEKGKCIFLAEKAWVYGQKNNTDRRTLFVAEELLAAIELYKIKSQLINKEKIENLTLELLSRQEFNTSGISGYFMEKDAEDGYRSVAFSSEPMMALLSYFETFENAESVLLQKVKASIIEYADKYLIADATNNAFGYTPYGIYVNPPFPDYQKFRETGVKNRYIRSFIHVYGEKQMPHGCGGVLMSQACFLAKAGKKLKIKRYTEHAERLIQWTTGHNPAEVCFATGLGFKHAVPASYVVYKVPEAMSVGFMGYPDDKPYQETSNAIEWSTQEIWDVPFFYTVCAIQYLKTN
jgi:hypothetical protein